MKFHVAESHRPQGGNRKGDTVLSMQHRWNTCCQSIEEHRFDCAATPAEQRGVGPVGPVRALTPAEMVQRLRST